MVCNEDSYCADVCSNNPCQNDGTCELDSKGYKCTCQEGFSGEDCQISKSPIIVDELDIIIALSCSSISTSSPNHKKYHRKCHQDCGPNSSLPATSCVGHSYLHRGVGDMCPGLYWLP